MPHTPHGLHGYSQATFLSDVLVAYKIVTFPTICEAANSLRRHNAMVNSLIAAAARKRPGAGGAVLSRRNADSRLCSGRRATSGHNRRLSVHYALSTLATRPRTRSLRLD